MPWWTWGSFGIVLLVVETGMTRDFTLFCIGVSAIAVAVTTAFGLSNVSLQLICFVLLSGTALFLARGWLRAKSFVNGSSEHEFSNIVGEVALPFEDLPAYGFGKAELRGTTWSAHNAANIPIFRGQRCRVMKVQNLTLWIMPE
jgi:membrane protein implicated in regulation of membrane protease activity